MNSRAKNYPRNNLHFTLSTLELLFFIFFFFLIAYKHLVGKQCQKQQHLQFLHPPWILLNSLKSNSTLTVLSPETTSFPRFLLPRHPPLPNPLFPSTSLSMPPPTPPSASSSRTLRPPKNSPSSSTSTAADSSSSTPPPSSPTTSAPLSPPLSLPSSPPWTTASAPNTASRPPTTTPSTPSSGPRPIPGSATTWTSPSASSWEAARGKHRLLRSAMCTRPRSLPSQNPRHLYERALFQWVPALRLWTPSR